MVPEILRIASSLEGEPPPAQFLPGALSGGPGDNLRRKYTNFDQMVRCLRVLSFYKIIGMSVFVNNVTVLLWFLMVSHNKI